MEDAIWGCAYTCLRAVTDGEKGRHGGRNPGWGVQGREGHHKVQETSRFDSFRERRVAGHCSWREQHVQELGSWRGCELRKQARLVGQKGDRASRQGHRGGIRYWT